MSALAVYYRPWTPPVASSSPLSADPSSSLQHSPPLPPSSSSSSSSSSSARPSARVSPAASPLFPQHGGVALSTTDSEPSSDADELSASSRDESSLPSSGPHSPASSSSPLSPSHHRRPSNPYDAERLPHADDAFASFLPFFEPLLSPDVAVRATAMAEIRTAVMASLTPPQSPSLVALHFPSLLRLALEAAFKDVREGFIQLLALIADVDPRYANVLPAQSGATDLIPDHLLPSAESDASELTSPVARAEDSGEDEYSSSSELLLELFLSSGRVSHFDRLLSFHPSFYVRWSATLDTLMADSGPLPLPDRHYLALMAASRFPSSAYFLSYHSSLFLYHHGDPAWLSDVRHAPKHLQALSSLSTQLAFAPYALRSSDIDRCMKEGGMSTSELVHAVTILATYHAASALASALRVHEEVDLGRLVQRVKGSPSASRGSSRKNSVAGVDAAAPAVATRRDSKGDLVSEAAFLRRVLSDGHLETEEVVALQSEERIEAQIFPETEAIPLDALYSSASPPLSSTSDHSASAPSPSFVSALGSGRFFADPSEAAQTPSAFLPSPSSPLFSFSSFTFHEHACMALNRYYQPAFSSLLLSEMEHIASMTTHHIGRWDENEPSTSAPSIDTSPFRRAMWLFVHRYFGLFHEDFSYRTMGKLLSAPLQAFMLRVCEGRGMEAEEWALPGFELTESEKVHVALIVMEARRQAELIYAMHAVVQLTDGH